jgi:membrane-associated phospholipid phosphatase
VSLRLRSNWPLKLVGIPVFVGLFFTAYFLLLRHPIFPVRLMPVSAIDRGIGYSPWALGAYFSLWFYVSLAPSLLKDRRELLFHGTVAAAMGLTGLMVFFFWPTAVPVGAGLSANDLEALAWLKQVDAAGNACPSLHVAFAVFSGIWLDRVLRDLRMPWTRPINLIWCLAICYSTLATKQHVLLDVVGGAALGGIAGIVRRRERSGNRSPSQIESASFEKAEAPK